MRCLPLFVFAIFGCSLLGACSSSTVPATEDDDDVLSSSSKTKNSSSSVKGEGSGSESGDIDNECVGETGNPWDGTTAKEFACGTGTKLSPYMILTAEQLAHLSFIVGAKDKDYDGKYFKLGADIILNEGDVIDENGALVADSTKLHKWTPIGNSNVAFTGNFDGDGHSVSGMFINTTSTHNGLFGNSSGTIQNVAVENGWVKGGNSTAGVIGSIASEGVVRNAHNKNSVTGTGEGSGGIAGTKIYNAYQKVAKLENCSNRGVVKGKKLVAGIVGSVSNNLNIVDVQNEGVIEGDYGVAGIVGHLGTNTLVEQSVNKGNIYGKEYTAGLVSFAGYLQGSASNKYGTLDRVVNYGVVEGTKYTAGVVGEAACYNVLSVANLGTVVGGDYVGGVAGHSKYAKIDGVYNRGDISAKTRVGGITGYNQEGVTSSAYSTGKVDGDSLVGLMIGYNYNTTMADYYYLKQGDQEPFGLNNGGGVATPKTAEEMKSQEFAEILGEDFVYDSKMNDGYPVLGWEK
ncbi:MAG: hypothetical protein MJZ26_14465 [Fibrobacter sp.]|nr:hypothetical protein [Fibrobacter sp.]